MYLFGANGHGKVVAEIAEHNAIKIDAFIDDDIVKNSIFEYQVIHLVPKENIDVILSIGDNVKRKKLAELHENFSYLTLIHPKTSISERAEINVGTVVMAGVSINSDAYIGKHCIINTNASVDHDCILDDFVHISPNAALAGNVEIGEGTQVGIGSSIIQNIKVGKWCTIGAGAVIIKDIPDYAVVVGNPGKIIKFNSI